jgi:hypothetical protein
MSAEDVKVRLAELGVEEAVAEKIVNDLGATSVSDLASLGESDLVGVGMKTLRARALVKELTAHATPAPSMINPSMAQLDVLPILPDDASWLSALKTGGVLKFNRDTVIGTVSAALADRVGLYDIPDRIVAAMEETAESLDEPVGTEFYDMQRMLTQRSYAEVFASIPGATGRFATDRRKKELLAKMNQNLWPSLISFQGMLGAWMDMWQKQFGNPAAMVSALAGMVGGGGVMPPGMMAPPPTDSLRDSAEVVTTSINRIFAGTGIPVAMALAYDAQQIRAALESPGLPAQVGAVNRDQMLKKLGVAVTSDYPRMEQNLKRYTLGVIELPNVTAGQTEISFITALYQLGSMIQWDLLGVGSGKPTGIGGSRRDRL